MLAAPEDDTARLGYYHRLAGADLCLMLDREPAGNELSPRLFPLEEGRFVLVFEGEERLADFAAAPVPYAALPGRVIMAMLAGRGVGLGVNLGDGASAFLMPPASVDWLAGLLAQAPEPASDRPDRWLAPDAPGLAARLEDLLAGLGNLVAGAWLAGTEGPGRRRHALVLADAAAGAEAPLAKAAGEALAFAGAEETDLIFLAGADCTALGLPAVAERVAIAAPPEPPVPAAPAPPGSDPARPPRLR